MQTEFDHIVAGGGFAGGATVAPLAEQPSAQICVIAAGRSDHDVGLELSFDLVQLTRSNAAARVAPCIMPANTNVPSTMIGWQIEGQVAATAAERTAA